MVLFHRAVRDPEPEPAPLADNVLCVNQAYCNLVSPPNDPPSLKKNVIALSALAKEFVPFRELNLGIIL